MADEKQDAAKTAPAEKPKAKAKAEKPVEKAAEKPAQPAEQHIAEVGGGEYVAIGGGQVRRKDQA